MSKLFSFLTAAALTLGLSAGAQATDIISEISSLQISSAQQAALFDLGWKVGDRAEYNLKAGMMTGKIKSVIREETAEGYWNEQNISIMGQEIKVEILFDKDSGQVLKILVNGEEQQPPNPDDYEVMETRNEDVTVPAGTFESMYIKIKKRDTGEIQEAWANPTKIPTGGMIKSLADSQMGKVTIELTSFSRAQ